jgi:hypothetical protein
MTPVINGWAIVISIVVSVVLGFLWYGPLFGKKWMALNGMTMPDPKPGFSTMIKPMLISFVGAFFMSYVLSIAISIGQTLGQTGIACALAIAVTNWLGFIVPIHFNSAGWEGKPWTLFFINTGYWLVYLLVIAAVIEAML